MQRETIMYQVIVGLALVTIGLSSSVFHLGKPLRAWRAFSQWRTSWLSREGIASLVAYAPALLLAWLVWHGDTGTFLRLAGISLTLCCLATVGCTAMIYASLKPIPAWQHKFVVSGFVTFALLTGLMLFFAMTASSGWRPSPIALFDMTVLVVTLAAIKLVYWRDIDRIAMPSREAATALEGIGKVTLFERPHTEANYLTIEMGFVLARKHARKLRIIGLLLFAGIPLLALLMIVLLPTTTVAGLWIAALSAIAGAFVERWLFFAEARHMVMLYY